MIASRRTRTLCNGFRLRQAQGFSVPIASRLSECADRLRPMSSRIPSTNRFDKCIGYLCSPPRLHQLKTYIVSHLRGYSGACSTVESHHETADDEDLPLSHESLAWLCCIIGSFGMMFDLGLSKGRLNHAWNSFLCEEDGCTDQNVLACLKYSNVIALGTAVPSAVFVRITVSSASFLPVVRELYICATIFGLVGFSGGLLCTWLRDAGVSHLPDWAKSSKKSS